MRALILGGTGMLGHRVWLTFRDRFDTRVAVRKKPSGTLFDDDRVIEDLSAHTVRAIINQVKPQVVINCVGLVKQRDEASDPITSISINSLFPHLAASACRSIGARLINVSTDCVFSGARGGYRETEIPDPPDLYGRSKLLGEVAAPHLTIRTSIVGPELREPFHGLLGWFLQNRGGRVKGFTKALFSGVSSPLLARVLADVAETHKDLEGLWHVAGDPISKYDLLMLLNDAFHAGVTVDPDDSVVIDRTLDGNRFKTTTGIVIPSWREMAKELAQ